MQFLHYTKTLKITIYNKLVSYRLNNSVKYCNFRAETMNRRKVIIVGAGASGIAAAVKLHTVGIDYQILEAENRIGGRINSVYFGESIIDLGAQWCHGEDGNIAYQYVKDLNLLAPSFCTYRDNTFYESTGRVLDKKFTDQLALIYATCYDEELKDVQGSFGDYFTTLYKKQIHKEFRGEELKIALNLLEWFHKFTLCYNACPNWFDLSSSGLSSYKECEGNPVLNWKNKGFTTILDVLMNKYPDGSKTIPIENNIIFNKTVNKITWDSPIIGVQIDCEDGDRYLADHVIITTSLGVLKEQYKSLFQPQLPVFKQNAIEGLSIGTVNKIFLKFPRKWWPDNCQGFSLVWTEDDKINIRNDFQTNNKKTWLEDVFGFYVIDSEPTTLLGWVVGELNDEFEQLTDDVVEIGCLYLLNKFLGNKYDIPLPNTILCSRWKQNKNFRGSYSYRSLETDRRNTSATDLSTVINGSDVNRPPRLLFAGEATHPYFYSTVHGAIETGFREATKIIDYLHRNNAPLRSQL